MCWPPPTRSIQRRNTCSARQTTRPFLLGTGSRAPASACRPIVFVYELKHDLNLYLRDWATGIAMRNLADIIAFNSRNTERALRFGQDIFLAAEATHGDLSEVEYQSARQMDLRASRTLGLDAYMTQYRLDAV